MLCQECAYQSRCLHWAPRRCSDFRPKPSPGNATDLGAFERAFVAVWHEPVVWSDLVAPAVSPVLA